MPSKKEFIQIGHNTSVEIGKIKITNCPLYHPGGSFGYRIECDGKTVVYATDSEYKTSTANRLNNISTFSGMPTS
jgi:Cft2 family RNA processing exonuclease